MFEILIIIKFICRLAKEEEMQESRKRVDELEKENLELATQLAKKEAELDVKTQEKEDIEANLERTKEKLETETARHNELKHRLSESDAKIDSSSSKPMGMIFNFTKKNSIFNLLQFVPNLSQIVTNAS